MAPSLVQPRRSTIRSRTYWLRLLRLFIAALALALVVTPFALGAMSIWGLTRPPCSIGSSPAALNMPFEEITFVSARGIIQQGYFMPGTNGATVVIVPAFDRGRGAELHYARVFHDAGFSVLSYNSRVCTSQGWFSLGSQEVEDVRAAYEYLQTRADVDAARVGLHGFSSAGATALMAMAQLPELRAVSAEGGYHDYADLLGLRGAGTFIASLYQSGAVAAYRLLTGDDIDRLSPLNAIGSIGARPVLLVYGSREVTLPGARLMLERARANGVPAALWVVEGAGHGQYLSIAPDEFVKRVAGFHRAALSGESE